MIQASNLRSLRPTSKENWRLSKQKPYQRRTKSQNHKTQTSLNAKSKFKRQGPILVTDQAGKFESKRMERQKGTCIASNVRRRLLQIWSIAMTAMFASMGWIIIVFFTANVLEEEMSDTFTDRFSCLSLILHSSLEYSFTMPLQNVTRWK